jgi:hypothetical protein
MPIREPHFSILVPRLLSGKVILFLGAGVNQFTRAQGVTWTPGKTLPNGSELSRFLARGCAYTEGDQDDLLRVAQYMALVEGSAPLYESLRGLFDVDYPSTPLHDLIAQLPKLLRDAKSLRGYPLIITTNYDDVLERTLTRAGESYDVVFYAADGEHRGKFWHVPPSGAPILVEKPNEYQGVSPSERTVILKIHGNVDRKEAERDSYVVTEDHYIDYLTRTDVATLVPAMLAKAMNTSHFLFLGYGLRDWNLRVILHRMWGQRRLSYTSWAVQLGAKPLDQRFWAARGVEVIDADLGAYVSELSQRCKAATTGAAVNG